MMMRVTATIICIAYSLYTRHYFKNFRCINSFIPKERRYYYLHLTDENIIAQKKI